MINFLLLIGVVVGLSGLIALAFSVIFQWLFPDLKFWIGILLGATVATYITIKVRNHKDSQLIRAYERKKHRELIKQPLISKPIKQSITQPVMDKVKIDELVEGLSRYGYDKRESATAVKKIISENPKASDEEIITQAIHQLSANVV